MYTDLVGAVVSKGCQPSQPAMDGRFRGVTGLEAILESSHLEEDKALHLLSELHRRRRMRLRDGALRGNKVSIGVARASVEDIPISVGQDNSCHSQSCG